MDRIENQCPARESRSVSVECSDRLCINCTRFEQHYRRNRGNVMGWVPTSSGYCRLHNRSRGALARPCRDFEKEK